MTSPRTVLWISAHPEPRSLTGSLRSSGIARLREAGHRVVETDLYAAEWDPVLASAPFASPSERFDATRDVRRAYLDGTLPDDVHAEQRKLRDADGLVLQFPLWWYGVPAILKGWIDRVFTSGFAFGNDPDTGVRLRFENGPFRGKRALTVVTLGDRAEAIGPRGISGELPDLLFWLLHGTLAYTGMDPLRPFALPSADFTDEPGFAEAERRLHARLDALFDEAPLRFRPQFQGDYTDRWELAEHVAPGRTGLRVHWLDE